MTGFEPWTSGIGSDCSFNCATGESVFLLNNLYATKMKGLIGIQTNIVSVRDKHADHFTTTTARGRFNFLKPKDFISI